jgi:hypothetical protein
MFSGWWLPVLAGAAGLAVALNCLRWRADLPVFLEQCRDKRGMRGPLSGGCRLGVGTEETTSR